MSRIFVIAVALLMIAQTSPVTAKQSHSPGNGTACAIAWSPDGKTLAIGGNRGIWFYTPDLSPVSHMDSKDKEITALAWNPNGKQLATVHGIDKIQLWDIASSKIQPLEKSATPTKYWIGSISYSPDGKRIAGANGKSGAHIWDTTTSKLLSTLRSDATAYSVAWQPEGNWLAVGTGQLKPIKERWNDNKIGINDTAILQIWDVSSQKLIRTFMPVGITPLDDMGFLPPIRTVQWFNNGKAIVGVTQSQFSFFAYDVEHDQALDIMDADTTQIGGSGLTAIMYAPDGKSRATVTWAGVTSVFMFTTTGHSQFKLDESNEIRALAWSPDSQRFAVISGDGRIFMLGVENKTFNAGPIASTDDFKSPSECGNWRLL